MIDPQYFDDLVTTATAGLVGDEILLASLDAEQTDFVRFNHAKVRQAGNVRQSTLGLDLVEGARHTQASVELTGDRETDDARTAAVIGLLREQRAFVPDDPHLIVNTEPTSTTQIGEDALPDHGDTVAAIVDGAGDRDLVGVYTSGPTASGFANSLGQRNWFQTSTFNVDWTFYLRADKAAKSSYAGFEWDDHAFDRALRDAAGKLDALGRTPIDLAPGEYRSYLTPAALDEIINLLSYGAFGVRSQKTSQSSLLRLVAGKDALAPSVRISEDTAGGIAPNFQEQGFLRPDEVVFVDNGTAVDALVSPRSAVEFDLAANGASSDESPRSLAIAGGDLDADAAIAELGTGLYVGNLWYTNYSDRSASRVTGMTRFATFWVDGGEIVAPVNVMRFDDTLYSLLGSKLEALTAEPEFLFDNSTYERRTPASVKLPGALVSGMKFTL